MKKDSAIKEGKGGAEMVEKKDRMAMSLRRGETRSRPRIAIN